jgi:tetratricopeptide (TPR) repeat protein
MATGKIFAAALLAASSIPAAAAVMTVGSNSARLCYESADSGLYPTPAALARCDTALSEAGTPFRDIVATYVNRGILKLRRGQIEASIADFDTALRMDPRQPEAYLNKGAALMRQDNARGALPLFTVALENHTNRPDIAHFGRAIAYETLGDVNAAYRDYRRATELAPGWEVARAELARFRVVPR